MAPDALQEGHLMCECIHPLPPSLILLYLICACVREVSYHLCSCAGRPWSSCLDQGHAVAAPYVERVDDELTLLTRPGQMQRWV